MKPIGYYNYTVIATYLGLAAALCGCYLATQDQCRLALLCLILAGCFDMVDGRIASTRPRTEDERSFGIQIDSLCDLVSFGVLPSMIMLCFPLPLPLCILIGILFTLAAIIRLSYYNVTEINRQRNESGKRTSYLGLPVTCDALLLPMVYLLSPLLGDVFGWIYAAALLVIGILFLTPFRLPKASPRMMIAMSLVGALTVAMLFVI